MNKTILSPRIAQIEQLCAKEPTVPSYEASWLIRTLRTKMAECEALRKDLTEKERIISATTEVIEELRGILKGVLSVTETTRQESERTAL